IILPNNVLNLYEYIINLIGYIYIIIEAGQIVGISIIIGEKTSEWINYVDENNIENSNDTCEYRKILAIIFTLIIYLLSFYLIFLIYFNNYYNNNNNNNNISYPISFIFIQLWIVFCIIIVTILSYIFRYGIITQAAFISLYLSFILNNIEH